ncbi:flagellar filament capping protein FliD [Bacillus carboniphilus]|uniref:Flagellar hook-associated protein 2 n=1 Tax=Bacillus carboniphilus TaxID=86663 RepID=A0ABY9JQ28_9BACI|nr:flagellar filament capping protein FliD [Bacillus carboniphilus]WLR41486.1 flagellar filament capping protein FliD [Bacillus carboniphilus]
MSTLRISGLASGMDTESMVKELVKAESYKVNKYYREKQTLEWKRDAYREMNSLIYDFRSKVSDLKLSKNYLVRTTTSSNSNLVTATASSRADASSYTVSSVTQLATAATRNSKERLSSSSENQIDADSSLYDIKDEFKNGDFDWQKGSVRNEYIDVDSEGKEFQLTIEDRVVVDTENFQVKVDGKRYTVVSSGEPQSGEVIMSSDGKLTFGEEIDEGSKIEVDFITDKRIEKSEITAEQTEWKLSSPFMDVSNDSLMKVTYDGITYNLSEDGQFVNSEGAVLGTVDEQEGLITFTEGFVEEGKSILVEYQQYYSQFSLKTASKSGDIEETFFVTGDESLNNVISKLNKSDVGVTAFYDESSDKVSFTRSQTGDFLDGDEIVGEGAFFEKILQLGETVEQGGTNAMFTVNGLETSRPSNTFTINGVTFTLKSQFTDQSVSIGVSNDTNAVFENIKNFVEEYNKLIEEINSKLSEEKYSDYEPLTDGERAELTETQQEKWDELAKSGVIRNDSTLSNLLSQLRIDMYTEVKDDVVSSQYNQLSELGITTTSNYLEGGKLKIDEDQLKEAIENDPQSIYNLFTASDDAYGNQGIMQRVYDRLTNAYSLLVDKAGTSLSVQSSYTIGNSIVDVEDAIDTWEDRLETIEERYWSQFTAMEKAIQKANSQMEYLYNYFSSES